VLALALVSLLGSACASERPRPIQPADDLHDPNPSVRSQAASEVARRGDQRLIPELIELLDDEDGAVRLVAGQALRELTGRDSGYRAYAPEPELRRQVEDWRAWWASRPASRAPAAAPPAPLVPGSRT
jgi:HEAT repeat protein